jgi:Na+-driven multidrug efflux pump
MIFAALYAIAVIVRQYGGFHAFSLSELRADVRPILAIMLPAVLTNLATPVGGFITYRFIAGYSDDIVAGYAVVGRIVPVAFCLLFSLSGAIGPIVGQNFGAGQFDRVRAALYQAAGFALGYALLIWPLLYVLSQPIGDLFKLGSEGQYVLWLFTAIAAPLFAFNGILFIANAAFNNLDRASWSTALNWGRNTVGIVPLIWLGQPAFGVAAIVLAPAIGGIGFGLLAFWLAVRLVDQRTAERLGAGEAAPAAIAPG